MASQRLPDLVVRSQPTDGGLLGRSWSSELANLGEQPTFGLKYSTGSSVYTDQTIINPNSVELIGCIAAVLQVEIFENHETSYARQADVNFPELVMETTLPPHMGGPSFPLPQDILEHETHDDPELRELMLAGDCPSIDTIYRFISFVFYAAKYTAQCNIIAFIYVKRIITSQPMLNMRNWRALWIGAVILAQKFVDDISVRTSSFCDILPGVTKKQLKLVELTVFGLMKYSGRVKPSVYAQFYFELQAIFQSISSQLVTQRQATLAAGSPLRPLTLRAGRALQEEPQPPRRPQHRSQPSTASQPTHSSSCQPLPPVRVFGHGQLHGHAPGEVTVPETDTRASTAASQRATTPTPAGQPAGIADISEPGRIFNDIQAAGGNGNTTGHGALSLPSVLHLHPQARRIATEDRLPAVGIPTSREQQPTRSRSGSNRARGKKGHKTRSISTEDVGLAYARALFIIN